jgi:SAM-dependent methyltransferase
MGLDPGAAHRSRGNRVGAAMTNHSLLAPIHEWATGPLERRSLGTWRHQLLAHARGRVLDLGGGTGINLAHYSPDLVDSVVVGQPGGAVGRRLGQRISRSAVPVTVSPVGVSPLPFCPDSFDTIVCTLVLCKVPDLDAALNELETLLGPGGRLLFLEHVRGLRAIASVQRALDPIWARLGSGCHLDRDTVWALRRAGFAVTDCERPTPFGRWSSGVFVVGEAMAHLEAA